MQRRLLNPKIDFVFKKIFGSEENPKILIGFLNAVLKPSIPIVDVEIKNTAVVSPVADAVVFACKGYEMKAIEKAESVEAEALTEAIHTTTNYKGVSGKITFDDAGEPKKPINVDIIQNGKFVSVYTVN